MSTIMRPTKRLHCLPSIAEVTFADLSSPQRRRSIGDAVQRRLSVTEPKVPEFAAQLATCLKIIWYFAVSDIKTMVLPVTTFGVLSALGSDHLFTQHLSLAHVLLRTPLVVLWVWLNVVLLSISNQRNPDGQVEDRVNKPWRPIVSGMITADQSRQLLLVMGPVVALTGTALGISQETFWAIAGSWYYSDLGGADEHWLMRQFLNGLAYIAYGAGVCRILAGPNVAFLPAFWIWLTFICFVTGTTIQIQDLKDEEGDKLRNRSTAPIILGSQMTRWSVAVGVLYWSALCCLLWGASVLSMAVPFALAGVISYRVLHLRTSKADKMSFVIWSLWMTSLFALPALKNFSV